MATAIEDVEKLLKNLPENSNLEDVQYHLYVLEKIRHSIHRTENEGTIEQTKAEEQIRKWISQ